MKNLLFLSALLSFCTPCSSFGMDLKEALDLSTIMNRIQAVHYFQGSHKEKSYEKYYAKIGEETSSSGEITTVTLEAIRYLSGKKTDQIKASVIKTTPTAINQDCQIQSERIPVQSYYLAILETKRSQNPKFKNV